MFEDTPQLQSAPFDASANINIEDPHIVWDRTSGPLPPPEVLAAYEKAAPGASQELMRLLEANSARTAELQAQAMAAQARRLRYAFWLKILLGTATALGGTWLFGEGESAGLALSAGGLMGIVAMVLEKKK